MIARMRSRKILGEEKLILMITLFKRNVDPQTGPEKFMLEKSMGIIYLE